MDRQRLRATVAHIGEALHEPEGFALRWHCEGTPYHAEVFVALALTSILGTTAYGLIMGLSAGPGTMFLSGLRCTAAAGIAWSLPLPALYVLNSISGSRLRPSTTFLAALVTTSWGGLAMLAAIPVAWFFTVALPYPTIIFSVHLAVFTIVGDFYSSCHFFRPFPAPAWRPFSASQFRPRQGFAKSRSPLSL